MIPRKRFLTIVSIVSAAALVTIVLKPASSTRAIAQEPPIVPAGGIIMWEGTSAPPGWCILDGSDSRCPTPNLTGLFIMAGGTRNANDNPGGPFPVTANKPSAPATLGTTPAPPTFTSSVTTTA